MKIDRELLLVVVGRHETMRSPMTIIADRGEIARLLATTDRISKVMNLCSGLAVTERTCASSEADYFEAKVIPPLHLLIGRFEAHLISPLLRRIIQALLRAFRQSSVIRERLGTTVSTSTNQHQPVSGDVTGYSLASRKKFLTIHRN